MVIIIQEDSPGSNRLERMAYALEQIKVCRDNIDNLLDYKDVLEKEQIDEITRADKMFWKLGKKLLAAKV